MKQNPQFATEQLITALGITTELGLHAARLAVQNLALLESKQRDYGRRNLDEFGSLGVLVRLNDKVSRLKNLIDARRPNHESLLDTWKDAANYALIGAVLESEMTGFEDRGAVAPLEPTPGHPPGDVDLMQTSGPDEYFPPFILSPQPSTVR